MISRKSSISYEIRRGGRFYDGKFKLNEGKVKMGVSPRGRTISNVIEFSALVIWMAFKRNTGLLYRMFHRKFCLAT